MALDLDDDDGYNDGLQGDAQISPDMGTGVAELKDAMGPAAGAADEEFGLAGGGGGAENVQSWRSEEKDGGGGPMVATTGADAGAAMAKEDKDAVSDWKNDDKMADGGGGGGLGSYPDASSKPGSSLDDEGGQAFEWQHLGNDPDTKERSWLAFEDEVMHFASLAILCSPLPLMLSRCTRSPGRSAAPADFKHPGGQLYAKQADHPGQGTAEVPGSGIPVLEHRSSSNESPDWIAVCAHPAVGRSISCAIGLLGAACCDGIRREGRSAARVPRLCSNPIYDLDSPIDMCCMICWACWAGGKGSITHKQERRCHGSEFLPPGWDHGWRRRRYGHSP